MAKPVIPDYDSIRSTIESAISEAISGGGDPRVTRRVDFALFMVAALTNDELVHEAPAIVGCKTPSALAHAAGE